MDKSVAWRRMGGAPALRQSSIRDHPPDGKPDLPPSIIF